MYLVEKAVWFWLVLLVASMVLYYQSRQTTSAVHLPLSVPILHIELPTKVTLHRADEHSPWLVAQEIANERLVDDLITRLQQPCEAVYDEQEVKQSTKQNSLQFQVGNETFWLGQYQSISQTYYIHHLSQVYLCDETLKYYLTLPKVKWLKGQ